MEVRIKLFARNGTKLTEPEQIGEYSSHASSSISCDRLNLRHLKEFDKKAKTNFNLDVGFETWIPKEPEDYCNDLREIQQWALAANGDTSSTAKEALGGADLVCVRGALTTIAVTPYNVDAGWRMVAVRVRGVIYLHDCATRDGTRFAKASGRLAHLMYWGFKFEQYLTTDAENNGDTSSPIDCRETFHAVFKTNLVRRGRETQLRLVYTAEMDAVDQSNRYVELKTMGEKMGDKFWQYKAHKWWMQATLSGIDRIVIGHRNPSSGVVTKLANMGTAQLSSNRKTDVMMTFLSTVLSEVEERLPEGEDYGSVQIRYDPEEERVYFEQAREQDTNLWIDEFRKLI